MVKLRCVRNIEGRGWAGVRRTRPAHMALAGRRREEGLQRPAGGNRAIWDPSPAGREPQTTSSSEPWEDESPLFPDGASASG
jgi:hypothetical protein